jgi:hypothetical protein
VAGPVVPGASALEGLCPFCQTPVGEADDGVPCPACGARHHADCWRENAGCSVYGCASAPDVGSRRPVDVPVSYWGREHKPCPMCGESILAAALRCRHCGATFESAQPESADDARRRAAARARGPATRRAAVWVFGLGVVPLTAPLGVVAGLLWYPRRRTELAMQPALYLALCRLGIGIGILQTAFGLVMLGLFGLFRGGA